MHSVQFTTTHWSVVLAASGETSPASAEALETLCRTYWYPLYAYLRRSGHQPAEAEDLVQGFFARFLEKDYLRGVEPSKGRFRSFLLAALKHYVENEWRKEHTIRRGGGFTFLSQDDRVEARYDLELPEALPPDELYDRTWAQTLLKQVRARLSKEYAAAGKSGLWEVLEPHLSAEPRGGSYGEAAKGLGMSVGAVKMAVLRMRRRYGEMLRAAISQTVSRPEEIDDEIRHLCAVIGS